MSVGFLTALSGCGGAENPVSQPGKPLTLSRPITQRHWSSPTTLRAQPSQTGSGFWEAVHEPFPQVPDNGGRAVLDHVQLIPITYDGYAPRDTLETFTAWLAGSDWITTIGAEYGVHPGTSVMNVHLSDAPPDAISDSEIQTFLSSAIQGGTLPAPGSTLSGGSTLSEPLYVLFYPQSTNVTLNWGPQQYASCVDFGGYHNFVESNGVHPRFAYAVIPTCGSDLSSVEVALSHEVAEAATDPFPADLSTSYAITDTNSPWYYVESEVGDLCEGQYLQEGRYLLQRIWSNSAAASGGDPCLPQTSDVYFNASTTPAQAQFAHAGQTLTFTVRGWSTAPRAPWTVQLLFGGGTFPIAASASIDKRELANGDTAQLTINLPTTLVSGDYGVLLLTSRADQGLVHFWPVAVVIQ